ncbi:lytic transglycosylase domain-containing protein [Bordetella genomosp. 11]|nr:lytic transglycosylase domain-containing protein [Bordetella genomosp. 11]
MPTVIDALVVTLGLDPSKYTQGSKKFVSDFRKSKEEAGRITSEMTEDERAAAKQREEIAKQEMAARTEYAKRVGMAISKVRNEALALLGVFTAGLGIKNFVGQTITQEAALNRVSENLSMSAQDLATWQLAAKNAGGTMEGMTAQLKESADAVANFKAGFGADSGMQFFFRMGGTTQDLKDGNSYLMARAKIVADIYKTDRQRAAVVAQGLGLDQAQFNLYRLGPQGIAQRRAEQAPLANELAAQSAGAEALRRKYDSAMNRFSAVGVNVLNAAMPSIDLIVDKIIELGNWIVDHKDQLNAAIKAFVDGMTELLGAVGKFVTKAFPQQVRDQANASKDPVKAYMDAAHDALKDAVTGGIKYDDPRLNDYATQVEKREGLPAGLLNSIKNRGERSNPDQVSPKGAMGVMQFMPDTWKQYGKGDPKDPYASIDAAGRYFKDLLKRYNGNVDAAITEYNGGVAQARAVQVGGTPSTPETIAYLERVRRGLPTDSTAAVVNAAQAAPTVAAGNTSTSTTTTETNFNGPITIHTPATDGHGIMRDLVQGAGNLTLATQANTGLR